MFPEPRSPRYQSMDQLRGIAALLVVLFHSTLYVEVTESQPVAQFVLGAIHWGWVAVPMFFVMSGYGIAASADSFRRKPHSTSRFFVRRLRRVFPPYWVFLIASIFVVGVTEHWLRPGLFSAGVRPIDDPAQLSAAQWFGNFSLAELWRDHFFGGEHNWFVGHVWTLAYEEQFYIVVGVLLLFARRRFFLAAGILTIVEILLRKSFSFFGLSAYIRGFFFDGQWEMFAAGMLVYYLLNYCDKIWQRAAVYLTILFMLTAHATEDRIQFTFPTAAWAFALLMAVLQPWEGWFAAKRITRPLCLCGTMCYSFYLVHWPITQAVGHLFAINGITSPMQTVLIVLPVCLVLSLAAGWLFYFTVERRYLNSVLQPTPSAALGQVTVKA